MSRCARSPGYAGGLLPSSARGCSGSIGRPDFSGRMHARPVSTVLVSVEYSCRRVQLINTCNGRNRVAVRRATRRDGVDKVGSRKSVRRFRENNFPFQLRQGRYLGTRLEQGCLDSRLCPLRKTSEQIKTSIGSFGSFLDLAPRSTPIERGFLQPPRRRVKVHAPKGVTELSSR